MTGPQKDGTTLEFAPPQQYLMFLWVTLAWVQLGLFFLWNIPWYRRELTDVRSIVVWSLFDLALLAGTLHATLFRVRVDDGGLRVLRWDFRWSRWGWDEISRLERRGSLLGARYSARGPRGGFRFAAVAVANAAGLAEIIVRRADLDDCGEETLSLQSGTRHLWLHPSVSDEM